MKPRSGCGWLVIGVLLLVDAAGAYPLDGYKDTGIRRVEGARLATEGVIRGSKQPPGARLGTAQVDLRLLHDPGLTLPKPDADFSNRILKLLGEDASAYSISILDLTDPATPRYAEHRGDHRQNVGSVGKLIGALGLFQALADVWPDDLDKRAEVLKNTIITADHFSHSDHHTIRIFDVDKRKLTRRPMRIGDQGNLWEYLDWMLSVSSNSAASMVMRDAMLLRHYARDYPVSEQEIKNYFRDTARAERTRLFQATFWQPITRNGLDITQLRQGSFLTRGGKQIVSGGGNSYGTSRSLVQFVLLMEQGRLVDEWTSRSFKRLLYMTERRIRYASSPALKDAAVYFKSGSLFGCRKEAGFKCGAYRGNVRNYMNSVAIVESPAGDYKLHYIVVLISNVLRKNSAVAHQSLATRIQRMLEKDHSE